MSQLGRFPSLNMNMCLSGVSPSLSTMINSENTAASHVSNASAYASNNKPYRGIRYDKEHVSIVGSSGKSGMTTGSVVNHKRQRPCEGISHEPASSVVENSCKSSYNHQGGGNEAISANVSCCTKDNISKEILGGEKKTKLYSDEYERKSESFISLRDEDDVHDPVTEKAAKIIAELDACLNDMLEITVKNAILMDSLVMVGANF